eukprot:363366-Chlamydomonas_euryale.AAC.7
MASDGGASDAERVGKASWRCDCRPCAARPGQRSQDLRTSAGSPHVGVTSASPALAFPGARRHTCALLRWKRLGRRGGEALPRRADSPTHGVTPRHSWRPTPPLRKGAPSLQVPDMGDPA